MRIYFIFRNRAVLITGVAVLLLVFLLLGTGSMLRKSPTFDESIHLTSGYSYWLRNDFRLQPESGVLIQKIQSLPLLVMSPEFPAADSRYWKLARQYKVAGSFFYQLGNNPEIMMFAGRFMNMLLGVLLGLVIFFWSRELFGNAGGLISLTLFAFSPSVLANARLCTADLGVALTFLVSAWTAWRMFAKLTPGRVAACSLSLAALFMVKYSAVLMIPVYLIMLGVRLIRGKALPVSGFGRRLTIPGGRKGRILGWLLGRRGGERAGDLAVYLGSLRVPVLDDR